MQASQIPPKFQLPFGTNASAGNIRQVPVTTSNPNAASQSLGFPPTTFTAEGAGGVAPDGRDMNGILNQTTAWSRWVAAGGAIVPYDATFQAAVGGYPSGALVGSVATPGTYWQSTADNNTTNPDTGGAGWVAWPSAATVPWSAPPQIGNVTPNRVFSTALSATSFTVADFASIGGDASVSGSLDVVGYINSATDLQIGGVGFAGSFGLSATFLTKLPTGQIIQGGRFFSPTGNADVINLPESFPNNFASLIISVGNEADGAVYVGNASIVPATLTSFKAWTFRNGTPTAGIGTGWVAFGN